MIAPILPSPVPLLRAPPFPEMQREVPHQSPPVYDIIENVERAQLFAAICEAQVGGTYWSKPARDVPSDCTVVRAKTQAQASDLECELDGRSVIQIPRYGSVPSLDPWSVLTNATQLFAHGDDEWVALATIAGLPVRVLSGGPYGKPGDTAGELANRAAEILRQPIPDPFGQGWLRPLEAIPVLAEWRRVIQANRGGDGETVVAACGISWWKRAEIRRFLWAPRVELKITNARKALSVAEAKGGALAIWPSRVSPDIIVEAGKRGIPLVRIEDGFVRSAGLGSNLVPPSSIIADRLGIYFDPYGPSDLETTLASAEFSPSLLARARHLRELIVAGGISKYARSDAGEAQVIVRNEERRVVLVPGQVEDDMSVLSGGGGIASNLELLRRARALEGDAEIWWRPHPDVDAGHRIGAVEDSAALDYADRIVREDSMPSLLDAADAVHTISSLTGFEALLRGCEVTCHGTPFYAGWGLTRDLVATPNRRGRSLSLDELVAGTLLLYPRYLDPVTGLPCPPEVLVRRMAQGEMPNRQGWIEPLRRLQGRIMARFRRRSGKAGGA